MIQEREGIGGFSYWPSVSDLFMTLFIIAIALVGSVLFVLLPVPADESVEQTISALERRVDQLESDGAALDKELSIEREQRKRLEQALAQCEARHAACSQAMAKNLDEPPIIVISNADRYFRLGSSALTPDFEDYLGSSSGAFETIASEIIRRNKDPLTRVDTLEIIGHTDGIPLAGRGNLDVELPSFLSGARQDLTRLRPGSNNDLGLLRALAVKQAWRRFIGEHSEQSQLESVEVRTYSAGQTLPVESGRFEQEDERARRIELRLTKLSRSNMPIPESPD